MGLVSSLINFLGSVSVTLLYSFFVEYYVAGMTRAMQG
jgi:hypothetical protein